MQGSYEHLSTSINLQPNLYSTISVWNVCGPIGLWHTFFNMPYRLFGHGVCNTSKVRGPFRKLPRFVYYICTICYLLSSWFTFWQHLLFHFPLEKERSPSHERDLWFQVSHCSGLRCSRSFQVACFLSFSIDLFDIHMIARS